MTPEVWFPVVTLVIGVGLAFLTDWLRAARETKASRKHLQEERMRALLAEQRDLLIQLSVTVTDFARSISLCHLEDLRNFRQGGDWGSKLIGNDVGMTAMENARKLALLNSRLLSDEMREQILRLSAVYGRVALAKGHEQAEAAIYEMAQLVEGNQIKIGNTIRAFDMVSFASFEQIASQLGIPERNLMR